MAWQIGGGGGGVTPEQSALLKHLYLDNNEKQVVSDYSFRTERPSSIIVGDMKISDSVETITYELSTGTRALALINRLNLSEGTKSNPKFPALGQSVFVDIELVSTDVLQLPYEAMSTVQKSGVIYGFDFRPAETGMFHIEYRRNSAIGELIVVGDLEVTQQMVDNAVLPTPIDTTLFLPNIITLSEGDNLHIKLEGPALRGNSLTQRAYYRARVLPVDERQINEDTLYTETDVNPVYIGCDYQVNTSSSVSGVTLTIPLIFTDAFKVQDANSSFSNTKPCIIDFSAFTYPAGAIVRGSSVGGQSVGTFRLENPKDAYKFYWDGEMWHYKDLFGKDGDFV